MTLFSLCARAEIQLSTLVDCIDGGLLKVLESMLRGLLLLRGRTMETYRRDVPWRRTTYTFYEDVPEDVPLKTYHADVPLKMFPAMDAVICNNIYAYCRRPQDAQLLGNHFGNASTYRSLHSLHAHQRDIVSRLNLSARFALKVGQIMLRPRNSSGSGSSTQKSHPMLYVIWLVGYANSHPVTK